MNDPMQIPSAITREHVLQAMANIKQTGVPPGAESTKFDVLAPDGDRLPPKLVMSIAAELATGKPLPRSEFSGGEETNSRLRQLGFDIELKPGITPTTLTLDDLKPGDTLSNSELTEVFAVGNASGMRWSGEKNVLVLITDHTKSLYDDRWAGDIFYYTGMGRLGDQTMTGQNLRLAQGAAAHLFEVFETDRYIYAGPVTLCGPVAQETQPDDTGKPRKAYVFPLKLADDIRPPVPDSAQVERIRRKRQAQLKPKSLDELRKLAAAGGHHQPGKRQVSSAAYDRDEAVAAYVKKAANGVCDLCKEAAPFKTTQGEPYLENHHVQPLAAGGADVIENAVALCPNCHRRMHIIGAPRDTKKLMARIAAREADVTMPPRPVHGVRGPSVRSPQRPADVPASPR